MGRQATRRIDAGASSRERIRTRHTASPRSMDSGRTVFTPSTRRATVQCGPARSAAAPAGSTKASSARSGPRRDWHRTPWHRSSRAVTGPSGSERQTASARCPMARGAPTRPRTVYRRTTSTFFSRIRPGACGPAPLVARPSLQPLRSTPLPTCRPGYAGRYWDLRRTRRARYGSRPPIGCSACAAAIVTTSTHLLNTTSANTASLTG